MVVLVLMDKWQYNFTASQNEKYSILKHVKTRVEFGG